MHVGSLQLSLLAFFMSLPGLCQVCLARIVRESGPFWNREGSMLYIPASMSTFGQLSILCHSHFEDVIHAW